MLSWLALFLALAATPPAGAGNLSKASDGYVYFHRIGADMAAHDAAVDDCAALSASLDRPYLQRIVGVGQPPAAMAVADVIVAAIQNAQQSHLDRRQFAANLENCMVARGWDVVRLDDTDGRRISRLPQPDQAAALAPWVGAPIVHGAVVRQFAPLTSQAQVVLGVYDHLPPPAISLTANARKTGQLVTPANPAKWSVLKSLGPDASLPDGSSAIVVRMWTSAPRHQLALWFGRLNGPGDDDSGGADLFEAASPVRFMWGPGPLLQTTFIVPVKPGRWRLLGPQGVSLCLGGPVFDVKPRGVVFAGSFDAAAEDYLSPDMSLETVKATLPTGGFAESLTPAHWINGEKSPCGLAWATTLYAYNMAGAGNVGDPTGNATENH